MAQKTARRDSQEIKRQKGSTTQAVLRRIYASPGALLSARDFSRLPQGAVSRALSRLHQEKVILRVGKGLYYVPKDTLLGRSAPSTGSVVRKALVDKARPTGALAANLLGMSTQVPANPEYVVVGTVPPSSAQVAHVHMRPRGHFAELGDIEASLLEFLRDLGRLSELSPEQTILRVNFIIRGESSATLDPARLRRARVIRDAGLGEPPRVRAMLGAILENVGLPSSLWKPLRASLNPSSRFNFGLFAALPNARAWQAK